MKTNWLVVVSLAILVLLQPALLLLAAHFGITSSFQASTELASVMGAIFTAGGLIVALVSLYSLANVDKVVQDGVTTALRTIPQQVDERIRTFLDAYTSFREAQDVWAKYHFPALGAIELLLVRAEQIEPTLRNLRRWGGELFFTAARASYLREHVQDGVYRECPQRLARPALAMKALQRLEEEFRHGPHEDSATIGVQIAELHALLGDHPKTVAHWIERARQRGALPVLDGINGITLVAGCRNEADAESVLSAYGRAPMSADDIKGPSTHVKTSSFRHLQYLARPSYCNTARRTRPSSRFERSTIGTARFSNGRRATNPRSARFAAESLSFRNSPCRLVARRTHRFLRSTRY